MKDASERAKAILDEFVDMNTAALVHTGFVDWLAAMPDDAPLLVSAIRSKLIELEAAARERLRLVRACTGGSTAPTT